MPTPPRPVDATLHGVVDYTAGTMLMTVFPKAVGLDGTRSGRQIRIAGAIHAGYSTLTDYPLGIVKLIPYRVHLAIDAIGALALAATPFVTGQYRRGPRHWRPHVVLCLMELGSLALSDPTGRGDYHGDLDAVRAANMENPHRKVHDMPRAVKPAVSSNNHPKGSERQAV
jgi:hypothetical protein